MPINEARIEIRPVIGVTPSLGSGAIDLGLPANYDLILDPALYEQALFTYQGENLTSLGSSSDITTYVFKDSFGTTFTSPKGANYIRYKVERVAGAAAPVTAHPVTIGMLGPGLPIVTESIHDGGAERIFILPPPTMNGAEWTSATSHLNGEVPPANTGRLILTFQMLLWKPRV